MKRLSLSALCLATALPALAQSADPRPPLWEFLTYDRIIQSIVQVGVMALRSQMGVTYGHVSGDLLAGQIAFSDVSLWPTVNWVPSGPCNLTADRIVIAGTPITEWDHQTVRLDVIGLSVSPGCVPRETRTVMLSLGLNALKADRVFATFDYRSGPSALDIDAHASLPGIGTLDATASFDYVWVHNIDSYESEPLPVAQLARANITFEDSGGLKRVGPLLKAEIGPPDAFAAMMLGGLNKAIGEWNGERAQNRAQKDFVASAERELKRFLNQGGRIALNIEPPKSVWLNRYTVEDAAKTFNDLRPLVSHRSLKQQAVLSPALLNAALNAPETLDDAQRLAAGTALATGIGVPRAIDTARQLLEPLVAAGNPDAALQVAKILEPDNPAAAYAFTLSAAASGTVHALGLLDELEARLTTEQALTLQAGAREGRAADALKKILRSGNIAALRSQALQHMTGNGAPRDYAVVYLLATLATAAGDGGAISLRDELDKRMRLRGDAASATWQKVARDAETQALAIWLEQGLASKFSSE